MNEGSPDLGVTPEHSQTPEKPAEQAEALKTSPSPETPAQGIEKQQDDIDKDIEKIKASVEQHALPADAEKPRDEKTEPAANPSSIGKDLKNQALFRTLKNVRQHLSPPQRALSKIVHQPVVDAVSEVSGKTVARPSGILGGGICAFLGSLFFVLLAKHVGFRYNYLMFIIFFVGGFAVGLVLEMLIRLVHHPKPRS